MLIYKILNTVNNKIYIGCTTKTMEERFNRHWARRKDKTPMARALLKYGKDSFIIGVIEFCDEKKEMFNREKYWIKSYNSNNRNFGYNATEGGVSGKFKHTKGYKFIKT